MADESYVQIEPESTGKKIRNLKMTVLQEDGTTADVYCQVISIVDEAGEPVNLSFDTGNQEDILHELRMIRQTLEIAFEIDGDIEEQTG